MTKLRCPSRALVSRKLYVSPSYVSNGHWAIRKDRLSPKGFAKLLASPFQQEMDDARMERTRPDPESPLSHRWIVLAETDGATYQTCYRLQSQTAPDVFTKAQVKYLDWLGVKPGDPLIGPADGALLTSAGDWLMPVRA